MMHSQSLLFRPLCMATATLGTGALVSGAITYLATRSIQLLAIRSAVAPLAIVTSFVACYLLRQLDFIKTTDEQVEFSFFGSYIAYIGLTIAGMVTGFIPGSMLGVAAMISTIVIGATFIPIYGSLC